MKSFYTSLINIFATNILTNTSAIMISYAEFTDFNKTNHNFSICDDWGWFYDEEHMILPNIIGHPHYTPVPTNKTQLYKSILKKIYPVGNPVLPLNDTKLMPSPLLPPQRSSYKNDETRKTQFSGYVQNGLIFSILVIIYICSPK